MAVNKPIYIILALSLLFTVIVQLAITRAIFFENYLNTRQISGVNYYLSMINESSKGNWILGSPYLMEWRYAPYLNPSLSFNSAGLFKRTFNLDIKSYAMIMGYLAVFAVMFLLLMAFAQIFNFGYFGYLTAAAYIFFPRNFLWNRTWSPEINFIPFALFLVFYFWPAEKPTSGPNESVGIASKFWKREIALAFLTGILFYVYPYYWTFALALLAASDLLEIFNRKKIIWETFYKYIAIGLLASLYGMHLWRIHELPYYQETMTRIGFLYSRLPAGWYTQAVLLASLSVFFWSRKRVFPKINSGILTGGVFDKIGAGLITGLIVLNQQIITGVQMEFNSHYLSAIILFLVVFWGSLTYLLLWNSGSYKNIFVSVCFFLIIGLVSARIYETPATPGPEDYIGGRADDVVGWFLDNQIRDRVVYAPEDLGDEINLWTDNYLAWNDNQALQLIPTAELIDRFTYFDLTNRSITDNLFDRQTAFFGQTFIATQQKDNVINKIKAKLSGKNFVPATLEEYTKYDFSPMREKRTNPNLAEFNKYLEKYHVDYLVYRQKDRNSIYGNVPGEKVFENEEYLIKKRL